MGKIFPANFNFRYGYQVLVRSMLNTDMFPRQYKSNDTEIKKIPVNVADWWVIELGKIWERINQSLIAEYAKSTMENKFRNIIFLVLDRR